MLTFIQLSLLDLFKVVYTFEVSYMLVVHGSILYYGSIKQKEIIKMQL